MRPACRIRVLNFRVLRVSAQLLETRTPVGKYASAPLLAMLAAIGMASCGALPAASPAFEVVWSWFLPLAAVLFLLETRFQRIGAAEGSTIAAFVVGAVGTVLGTIIAWVLVGEQLCGRQPMPLEFYQSHW